MGLDQWLIAKTKKRENKKEDHTGVCSGLFGIIPTTVANNIEIGYWRKGYAQRNLILEYAKPDLEDDEGNYLITLDGVKAILAEAQEILDTHTFSDDEEEFDLDDDEGTYYCKTKWENTVTFFKEALKILEEDPEAKIYYHEWY